MTSGNASDVDSACSDRLAARQPDNARGVHRLALSAAVFSGAVMAVQLHINGVMRDQLGNTLGAALVSLFVALLLTAVAVLSRSAGRRGLAAARRVPVWRQLGGLGGAAMVAVGAAAAPRLGVALLTVGIVAGQTAGAVLVDRVGLGPSGRHRLTMPRVGGAGLSLVAVAVGVLGRATGRPSLVLFLLVIGTGLLASVQQALNGWVGREVGDASVAAFLNFAVGTAAIAVGLLASGALSALTSWHWPPVYHWFLYLGGPLGVIVVGIAAVAVRTLGVLRLGLSVIAGQLLGGLALDFFVSSPGTAIELPTVLGALLTLVAVAITGLGSSTEPSPNH